ncbi:hypothetical protein LOZ58_005719 [Ophidiomyces ophidiicola]|nr:hypothetical protein LOZ58_005719 [Ophidiomyces ophidiicola]
MRVEPAPSPSTLSSRQPCFRSRSKTDPTARDDSSGHHHHHAAAGHSASRRSVDFAARHRASNSLSFTAASPLSSESFSNPALAGFSPRKVAAFKSAARSHAHSASTSTTATPSSNHHSSSSIPKLLLQTPRTTRDLDLQSPSSAFFNSPSAASSTVSPSESLYPPSTVDSAPRAPPPPPPQPPQLQQQPSYQKRAPASRSSLGIETSTGPPPALSTQQRSLTQERHALSSRDYANSRPRSFGPARKSDLSYVTAASADQKRSSLPTRSVYAAPRLALKDRPTSTLVSRRSESVADDEAEDEDGDAEEDDDDDQDEDEDLTARLDGNADVSSKGSDDSRQPGEDVFLNIARSASTRRGSAARIDRQRTSKIGSDFSRTRTNDELASPSRHVYESEDMSPLSGPYPGVDRSPAMDRSKYAPRPTVGLPRSRFSRTSSEISADPHARYSSERRGSAQDSVPLRAARPSHLSTTGRTHRALSNSDGPDRPKYDGTESTLSTTAPSTVWDELDDLKSRIRKLELTGKLPASSAAAMSSVSMERPRTATTMVTTISSSPKHGRKTSASPNAAAGSSVGDTAGAVDMQIQSLLRAALAKAKATLSPVVYGTLEATANDALTLASAFNPPPPPQQQQQQMGSGMSGAGGDRQAKRKIDSMCRSLTELCIALADERLARNRPSSRDAASGLLPQGNGVVDTGLGASTSSYRRSTSHEPTEDASRALAGSRLDGRRSSMLNLSTTSTSTVRGAPSEVDPQATVKLVPSSTSTNSRIARSSTTNNISNAGRSPYYPRRHETDVDDGNLAFPAKPALLARPLSRVFTDVPDSSSPPSSSSRPRSSLLRTRPSREFASPADVPSPSTNSTRTNTAAAAAAAGGTPSSGIPLRRSYLSAGTTTTTSSHIPPATALRLDVQPGYRRYGGSVITSSQQQETGSSPLAGGAGGGLRTASHYSSMQQLRPRTGSFGRRLSLRRAGE